MNGFIPRPGDFVRESGRSYVAGMDLLLQICPLCQTGLTVPTPDEHVHAITFGLHGRAEVVLTPHVRSCTALR